MKKIMLTGAMLFALASKGQTLTPMGVGSLNDIDSRYKSSVKIKAEGRKCMLSADSVAFVFPCNMERKQLHWFLDEMIEVEIQCHTKERQDEDTQWFMRALIGIQDKLRWVYWEVDSTTGIVRYGNKAAIKGSLY